MIYPGVLDQGELVEWVERFYSEYYFRPKAAWRIVRKAIFDGPERKRLYKEARDYMSLRTKRKQYVVDHKANALSKAAAAAQAAYPRPGLHAAACRFFAFIKLVETADLSFAVPASAASIVFETILARLVLKESVDSRRWWGVCLVALGVILLAE